MNPNFPAGRPNRAPTHPGAILRLDVLPALGLSVKEAAERIGVTRQQLHRVVSETAGISPEMALRLGKFCGNGPDLWISMQQAFDLWKAKKGIAKALDRIKTAQPPTAG
jgi:addiction module HigA family antidote